MISGPMERTTTPPVLEARPEGDGHPAVALAVLVTSFGLAMLGLAIAVVVRPSWNIGISYLLIVGAVYFAFRG